jgi:hypothetical protein
MSFADEFHRAKSHIVSEYFSSRADAVSASQKYKGEYTTKITKSRDYKNRNGSWAYMYTLTVRKKKGRI